MYLLRKAALVLAAVAIAVAGCSSGKSDPGPDSSATPSGVVVGSPGARDMTDLLTQHGFSMKDFKIGADGVSATYYPHDNSNCSLTLEPDMSLDSYAVAAVNGVPLNQQSATVKAALSGDSPTSDQLDATLASLRKQGSLRC